MPVSTPAMHRHAAVTVHQHAGLSIVAISPGSMARAEPTPSREIATVGSAPAMRLSPRPPRQPLTLDGSHVDASAPRAPAAGEGSRRPLSWPNLAMLAVLQIAAKIEPDPVAVLEWYRSTPISKLEGMPAEQLVTLGRVAEVIAFLCSIRDDTRP